MNPKHTVAHSFLKIRFNIILWYKPSSLVSYWVYWMYLRVPLKAKCSAHLTFLFVIMISALRVWIMALALFSPLFSVIYFPYVRRKSTNVLEQHVAPIFRCGEKSKKKRELSSPQEWYCQTPTWNLKLACSLETSVGFHGITWHCIPEDRNLHSDCCEILKSYRLRLRP
jgi:hypothetical protein